MIANLISVGDKRGYRKVWQLGALLLLLFPYILYLGYVIQVGRCHTDYDTFIGIGARFLGGHEVYTENSYYPLPFVMIFALLSRLPFEWSMAFWMILPVFLALLITRGKAWVLAYAPFFGHFIGCQASVFGMLGLWGYRQHRDPQDALGGMFLGLTLLKPQLGIVPLAYAAVQWWQDARSSRRVPRQVWAWLGTMSALNLPAFLVMPDWPARWLDSPRPLFERALSGFLPRTLLLFFSSRQALFWLLLVALGMGLLVGLWLLSGRRISFDMLVLWGFVVSPLVHDYDLIQLIPILENRQRQIAALLLSIPGWLVILFAYANDQAWYVFSLLPVGLLGLLLVRKRVEMQTGAVS